MQYRSRWQLEKYGLRPLVVILIVAYVIYIPFHPGTPSSNFNELLVPLGFLIALITYIHRLEFRGYAADQIAHIAQYGWFGIFLTGFLSGWLIPIRIQRGRPLVTYADDALAMLSLSVGVCLFFGAYKVNQYVNDSDLLDGSDRQIDFDDRHGSDFHIDFDEQHASGQEGVRERVLAESIWTHRPGPNPILVEIADVIAEIEGVDPLEMEPFCQHVNPEVFTVLTEGTDSHWQLSIYTDTYEIRVSSHGTVTVYDATGPGDDPVRTTNAGSSK